jgi:hypothetical protein
MVLHDAQCRINTINTRAEVVEKIIGAFAMIPLR